MTAALLLILGQLGTLALMQGNLAEARNVISPRHSRSTISAKPKAKRLFGTSWAGSQGAWEWDEAETVLQGEFENQRANW